MKYELEEGSPADYGDRLQKEQRCYKLLDSLNIEYWRCDHPDNAADTMEDITEVENMMNAMICKNLFLCNTQGTKFYLLMMPGNKKFKTKELSSQLGIARLSFASAENMEKYLDITPGSVSILGLMNDKDNAVQLLVDKDVYNSEFVGCHPCINTSSLKLKASDLFGPVLNAMGHEFTLVSLVGE